MAMVNIATLVFICALGCFYVDSNNWADFVPTSVKFVDIVKGIFKLLLEVWI